MYLLFEFKIRTKFQFQLCLKNVSLFAQLKVHIANDVECINRKSDIDNNVKNHQ